MAQHSTLIPAPFAAAYTAARGRAALIDRTSRGRIVVSGADRATYLQGLLTNDIVALKAGHGCYAAYLTAHGRMITDMHVYELGDVILLTTPGENKDAVLDRLDQFIFSEDVRLGDVTEAFAQFGLVGPDAAAVVASILGTAADTMSALPEHGNLRLDWNGSAAMVTRITDTGEPGFDVYVERGRAEGLAAAAAQAGVPALDDAAATALRIEAGVPLFHRDMDEETIPLEAGIEQRAVSFSKGCYVGQEVIIRVLHRGHGRVVRKLVGITFVGNVVPPAGTVLKSGERTIGMLTSSTMSPALGRPIALGYVHREFVEAGTPVMADDLPGTVSTLPFVAPAPRQPATAPSTP